MAPVLMPWLLRLAHVKSKVAGGDSAAALQESARGLLLWKVGWRAGGRAGGAGQGGGGGGGEWRGGTRSRQARVI